MAKLKKEEIDAIKEKKALMYIGPTLFNEGLSTGTVVRGEFDARMNSIFEKYQMIEHLFIPVDKDLGIMKRNVKIKGTIEHTIYNKVLETMGGKR